MSIAIQPVIADTGSEEVRLTRDQVNVLVNFIDAFKAATAAAADFAAFKVAVAALSTADMRQVVTTLNYAAGRRFPSH